MIIDAHAHIGSWPTLKESEYEIVESNKKYKISFTLLSDCDCSEFPSTHKYPAHIVSQEFGLRKVLQFVKHDPKHFGAAVWINPHNQTVTDELKDLIKKNREYIYALKMHPFESHLRITSPRMKPYLELAREFQLPILVHTAQDKYSDVRFLGMAFYTLYPRELLKTYSSTMDADVTGPSIPQAFGVKGQAVGDENGIFAMKTKHDLRLMSVNCLLDNASDPVLWRGPLIANLVGQLYTNVIYGEVEYFLIDMPPGTGDVPLTVFQQIPVDGVIIVASPQELVSMIVEKAVNMCKMMKIPLLGLVENMAYVQCPHCGEKIKIYGDDKSAEVAKRYGIPLLDELPIDPILSSATDKGEIEEVEKTFLPKATEKIIKL